ncbi:MAG TPA: 2-oxo-tetronate isomerase [Vineibacter sp.]|nr:2-oxo-tetronate isomerase [Vineibacter sp.]
MLKLAANLSWLYQDIPFMARFAAAAGHGFTAVEFLFPYEFAAGDIAAELKKHRLTQALFNLPPGDWNKGERGLAALPGREAEFAAALETALQYAGALDCPRIHVMSGLIATGADLALMRRTYIDNLKRAADRTAKAGVTLCLEPINRRDIPGYFLNTTTEAAAVIAAVGAPHVKIQFDLYHCQVTEGDLVRRAETLLPLIGHVQIAGNPDRNEPDIGEANHLFVLDALDRLGWDGHVGLEYRPKTTTAAGLAWARKYGITA